MSCMLHGVLTSDLGCRYLMGRIIGSCHLKSVAWPASGLRTGVCVFCRLAWGCGPRDGRLGILSMFIFCWGKSRVGVSGLGSPVLVGPSGVWRPPRAILVGGWPHWGRGFLGGGFFVAGWVVGCWGGSRVGCGLAVGANSALGEKLGNS